jgi:hypothetical protein
MEQGGEVEGLFPRAVWYDVLAHAGLPASSETDAWGRDVFICRKP